ncbi:MAG: zinc-dependent alcohol dehydrogenase family protein [Pseudomonadota bacterium]
MKAVYYEQFKKRPTIETLPDPTPAPDGVVVEVKASGVCRSDWHGWMGHDKDIVLPHVPGHELSGVVVATGRDVNRFKAGDRVTVPFVCGCNACAECDAGDQHVCRHQFQPGFTGWGSFAELVALRYADANLIRLPDTIDFITAASLGCRFATSFRGIVDQGQVAPGQWVAVFGCGGVGLAATMIAHAFDARVVAVDIDDSILALAESCGADVTLNCRGMSQLAVAEAIEALSGGGVHISVDALGHSTTSQSAISCLRRRGKHVQIGLMTGDHLASPIPWDRVVAWELEILGSHGMQAHRYPQMMEMIQAGKLQPEKLVGERISLEQSVDALVNTPKEKSPGIAVIQVGLS